MTNHYVRQGATGNNTGIDWNNANTQIPSQLIRGDTYYIAYGNYGSYTFDDIDNGQQIIVKKATTSDHGTDTGWQSSYAGQATFNSIISFTTSNYVFDGQIRNESNWFDGASYGFKIYHNGQNTNVIIRTSNISIKYVYVEAQYNVLNGRPYAFDCEYSNGENLLFHRSYVYGSNNVWFLRNTRSSIVEYCASDGAVSSGEYHGTVVNLYWTSPNHTSRYNIFRNEFTTATGTAVWAITTHSAASQAQSNNCDHAEIYGNVVYNYCAGDGIIGYIGGDANHMRVYNNTFVNGQPPGRTNCWGAGVAQSGGIDNLVYNNLWLNWQTGRLSIDVTHDYNTFSGSSNFGESHGQVNITSSIFRDYNNQDFRLAYNTEPGIVLPAPYNYDMFGNLRGTGGVWSRGAFQLTSGEPPTCPPVIASFNLNI